MRFYSNGLELLQISLSYEKAILEVYKSHTISLKVILNQIISSKRARQGKAKIPHYYRLFSMRCAFVERPDSHNTFVVVFFNIRESTPWLIHLLNGVCVKFTSDRQVHVSLEELYSYLDVVVANFFGRKIVEFLQVFLNGITRVWIKHGERDERERKGELSYTNLCKVKIFEFESVILSNTQNIEDA